MLKDKLYPDFIFYMLLAIDIGNTDIVFGVYDQKWLYQWRHPSRDLDHVESAFKAKLEENSIGPEVFEKIVLSSVVPKATVPVRQILEKLTGNPVFVLTPELFARIEMGVKKPTEIGADLVANAYAAYQHFQQACVVVDFGTALTFTTVSEEGNILGVAIAPGLKTAMNALFQNTAQLEMVPLEVPDSALGQNTAHALQAGILLGYVGLVKEILGRIKAELGVPVKVAATGGLSSVLAPLQEYFDLTDKMLTLNGLRLLVERYGRER